VVPSGGSFPTETTCATFNTGTATQLNTIGYTANGTINQDVAPGVWFYFSKFSTAGGALTVVQGENSTNGDHRFKVHNLPSGFAKLYDGNCNPIKDLTLGFSDTGVSDTVGSGTFIIQIKYDSKSLVGLVAPVPTTVHYTLQTFVGATLVDEDPNGLDLAPK